jgi:hypothetical protein
MCIYIHKHAVETQQLRFPFHHETSHLVSVYYYECVTLVAHAKYAL